MGRKLKKALWLSLIPPILIFVLWLVSNDRSDESIAELIVLSFIFGGCCFVLQLIWLSTSGQLFED